MLSRVIRMLPRPGRFVREFRHRFATFILTLASVGLSIDVAKSTELADDDRLPNIILIFADDLGWMDVSYQGSKTCRTPNLDRLATQGMVFSDAYATAGNCAPSRACLISGTYTPRHHVYAVGNTARGPKRLMRLVPVPNKGGIPKENITLADALKVAGYVTGQFGKWHLAGPDGALPTEQGFDVAFNSFGEGPLPEGSGGNKKGPPDDPKGVYALTHKACEFIEANKDRPFFCYLPHHAIHTPLQARPGTLRQFQDSPQQQKPRPLYAACTYDLDDSVGILLAKLKKLNLEENTLVVFTSDNGATNQSPQEPLRGNKGGYYEGGIREPFIARWPGVIKPGTTCRVPITNLDLYPTFLEAGGASVPEGKILDGESLVPLFKGGDALQRQAIFWHFPGYLNSPVIRGRDPIFRTRPVSVIRKGDWKLHLYHEEWQLDGGRDKITTNNAAELYNLAKDIGERKNLANAQPQKRDELLDDLLAWFKATDAKLPTEPNPDYRPE